jgi:uncharacterized membrane protein
MIGGLGGVVIREDNSKAAHEVRRGYVLGQARGIKGQEAVVNRYVVIYLATLVVLVALDFLFLGILAKGFFVAEAGDMLGEVRALPAALFYLLYVVGILVFVSAQGRRPRSTLLYGALFGLFCYATFDLTALALLKHWSWAVAVVDVSWGAVVTAVSSTAGLVVADALAPKG